VIALLPSFRLSRPTSLSSAFASLDEDGTAYVGGTELLAAMHLGLLAPAHLVDLKRVQELSGISRRGDRLLIGATTRHREVAASPLVAASAPVLRLACSQLGNPRVRSMGTIGGNLCFADPRSDVSTALFALQASLTLRSASGQRRLPIDEFVLGAMDVDLEDGELLESIEVPVASGAQVYLRHQPTEYPTVAVALVLSDGALRVVVGAIAERPQVYTAPSLDQLSVDELLPQLEAMEDLNGSAEYKRHLAGVFVNRAAAALREGLGG
jgi:carbon-monoxide dehydrogenase medium subunit